MGFDNLFFFEPVVLSLSLVLEMHWNEIHGRNEPGSGLSLPCPWISLLKSFFLKLMISCCSFLFDLTQLWGSHCKAFQEIIDNLVEAVALITLWFLNKISINVLLNPRISSLPSLQVIPYLVV